MMCEKCSSWVDEQEIIEGVLYCGHCSGYPNLYYTEEDLTCDIGCDYFT